ncbi:MAG: MOSC domain-containing protein [Lacipirellulaceae bacterium]
MREPTPQRPFGVLLAPHVGKPRGWDELRPADGDSGGLPSGIAKRPVDGPVWLGVNGLEGDGQGNLRVHGGPDKAVCAYAADHYPWWRDELGLPDFGPGAFGENFAIAGLDERGVAIGDRWRVGDALVEPSQPRQPCSTLSRYWGRADLPKRVVQSRRTGWYFRVIEEGVVTPGDRLELVERPHPEWTIDRANVVTLHEKGPSEDAQRLHDLPQVSQAWREQLRRRLR